MPSQIKCPENQRSIGSDTGIRTRVSAVRGRRPRPLDDIAKGRERRKAAYTLLKLSHA
jgi:hypothetical protein